MNDDFYKSEDEDIEINEDITGAATTEDSFYDPEEEGLSDFNFSDDELPIEEAPNEMEDAP